MWHRTGNIARHTADTGLLSLEDKTCPGCVENAGATVVETCSQAGRRLRVGNFLPKPYGPCVISQRGRTWGTALAASLALSELGTPPHPQTLGRKQQVIPAGPGREREKLEVHLYTPSPEARSPRSSATRSVDWSLDPVWGSGLDSPTLL